MQTTYTKTIKRKELMLWLKKPQTSASAWKGGIPFDVKLERPNKETTAAMLEAERIAKDPSVKGYNDLDELFADLKK